MTDGLLKRTAESKLFSFLYEHCRCSFLSEALVVSRTAFFLSFLDVSSYFSLFFFLKIGSQCVHVGSHSTTNQVFKCVVVVIPVLTIH